MSASGVKIANGLLLKGAIWTIGGFGLVTVFRLLTNIVLARRLAPDLFGLMLIVYTLRTGIELVSDIGIGQNIVYNKNAEKPDFYNTAWTIQIIRSIILWVFISAASGLISTFYNAPELYYLIPISGFGIVLGGFASVSRPLMQKRLQVVRLNLFEIAVAAFSLAAHIFFVYVTRTIWALVLGGLVSGLCTTIASYFLMPGLKQRFIISRVYTREILHFGKWIFLSSIVYFLSVNYDRLYFGKMIPLSVLGVYGIARSISDLSGGLVARLGGYLIFPLIARHSEAPRSELRNQVSLPRGRFLVVVAVGFSIAISSADLVIRVFYDDRYHAASWMLSILVAGSWFGILCSLGESTLLGLGKPFYGAAANALKLAILVVGLPLSIAKFGIAGGVIAVSLVDIWKYGPTLIGQKIEKFAFVRQDLFATLLMIILVSVFEFARLYAGFGTSFDSFPFNDLVSNLR